MKRYLVLSAVMSAAFAANAQNLNVSLPPNLWVASNTSTMQVENTPVGSTAAPAPQWAVQQWGGIPLTPPYNKPSAMFTGTNSKWNLSNSTVNVGYDAVTEPWLGGVYSLTHNTSTTPCGSEFDFFLLPKSYLSDFGPNASSVPYGFTQSKPFSQLTQLLIHAGLKVNAESITPQCSYNNATYIFAIYLRNYTTTQEFVYQLQLRSSGSPPTIPMGYQTGPTVFGADDHVSNIAPSQAIPTPGGGRVAFSAIDIYPRLKQIISQGWVYDGAGPSKLYFDSTLSNWRIDGMYVGQITFGGASISSSWDNVRLQAYP